MTSSDHNLVYLKLNVELAELGGIPIDFPLYSISSTLDETNHSKYGAGDSWIRFEGARMVALSVAFQ